MRPRRSQGLHGGGRHIWAHADLVATQPGSERFEVGVLGDDETLVVYFVGILVRPAWRTRFGSCIPHDHPAARFLLVSFPCVGRRLEW